MTGHAPTAACFDSHCHLDPDSFGDDAGVDAAVARARAAGVLRMVTVGAGYGAETAERAVAVASRHDDVWATVGVHPHDAKEWDPVLWNVILELAVHPKVVALGEMGLDFHYDNSPRDEQREVFRWQIRAALERELPIVVHDRGSQGECLKILLNERAFSGAGVLFHCYSGTVAEMEAIVEHGGHISIPGIITFPKADEMRGVARAVPLDRLLVETDSPFLSPVPLRGRRNEPANVVHVLGAIALARGLELAEVAATTWANASRYYRIDER